MISNIYVSIMVIYHLSIESFLSGINSQHLLLYFYKDNTDLL